jgi:WhiB family redox-sensing transcriptional regulator
MDWKEDAACKGIGIAIFFNRRTAEERQTALNLCAKCPVREECLDYALDHEASTTLRIGIWGGTIPKERGKTENDTDG